MSIAGSSPGCGRSRPSASSAASSVARPAFRKIEASIDQRLSETARVRQKNADLRILDPARRPRILPSHPDRVLALLHKTRLVDDQNTIRIAKRLNDIVPNLVAQRVRRPQAAAQQRLDPIRPLKAGLLGHQPTRLALHPRQQPVDERARRFPRSSRENTGPRRSLSRPSSSSHAKSDPDQSATMTTPPVNHNPNLIATAVLMKIR